jgi:hypothetical protein
MKKRSPKTAGRSHCRGAILVAAVMVVTTDVASEPWPPLPPARPPAAPTETERPPSPPSQISRTPDASTVAVAPETNECLTRLKSAGFEVESVETPKADNKDCRIENPVKLRSIPVHGREKPLLMPAQPILACRFAESLGGWLGSLVAPAILGATGSELTGASTGPGFECRNRNGVPSAKLSAHAEGLAIDIASFDLANKSRMMVNPEGAEQHVHTINAVRKAACGWFTTVLGPGADASHSDHLHVDLQMHGSSDRYRICQ